MIRNILIIFLLSAAGIAQAAELDSIRPLQRCVAGASGLVVNAAVTEVLKHSVHKLRPDGSANNSFPSRHTSWAFALSTAISSQLSDYSPWWSLGAYAAASVVGYQRVYAHRHYTSDVLGGAAVGIASAEIGNLIARAIFKRHYRWGADNDFRVTLGVHSGGIWPLAKLNGEKMYAIYTTGLRCAVPVAEHWGASGSLSCATAWSRNGNRMNIISITAGGFYRKRLSRAIALEPEISVGYGRLTAAPEGCPNNRFVFSGTVQLDYRLTRQWSTGIRAGYIRMPVPSLTATISSTVNF